MEMLRSGVPVEPLGIECMDWVEDPEDGIFLRHMVSTNNIYYKSDDAVAPIEQSPNDVSRHVQIFFFFSFIYHVYFYSRSYVTHFYFHT